MGAGRKKETYTLAPDSLNSYVNWSVRSLEKKDICGVIFGCKFSTIKECYAKKLFGLPAPHMAYIKNIDPGLTLFLFNYSNRTLHGIFEAASEGQLNIGTDPSPYPVQVKMRVRVRCEPLVEEKFTPVIADNYKDEKMFWFELDRDQTSKLLLRLFSPSPYVRAPSTYKYGIADLDQGMVIITQPHFELAHKEFGMSVTDQLASVKARGLPLPRAGMATNINPGKLVDLLCHLFHNPEATLQELIRYMPAPDFPTGGTIMGNHGVLDAYPTGPGRFLVRGKTKVELLDAKTKRNAVIITEVTESSTSTNEVPSQASKGAENPWSSAARAVYSRQDSREFSNAARGTSLTTIFEAASDPKALSPNGTDPSPYPAQMRVRVCCEPLVEEKFSPLIADNYKEEKMFELAHKEFGMSVTDQLASVKASVPPHDPGSKKRKWLEVGSSEPNDAEKLKKLKISKLHMGKLLSEYDRHDWSILVHAGRCISVSPGEKNIICINTVRFNDEPRPDNHLLYDDLRAPDCEVYLGINSTQSEFLMGNLNTLTRPQLHFPLPLVLSEAFTLAHSAYSTIRFTGYRYGHQPQRQPLPRDIGWPFNHDLTRKIMSKISSSADIARSEIACKLFGIVGRDSSVYENVNLTNHAPSQELTALMCMRRAAGNIKSFEIGVPGNDKPNYFYTRRVLEPFQYLGGLLTKISLFGLPQLSSTVDLQPIFARCPLLKEFQLHNVMMVLTEPMPVDMVLQSLAQHCRMLEVLVYDNRYGQGVQYLCISEGSLNGFVGNCRRVKNLSLCGVHLRDNQLLVILQELERLEKLDLSVSSGFRGYFLAQGGDVENIRLRDLKLEVCRNLTELQLEIFFLRLRAGCYPNMRNLVVKAGVMWGAAIRVGFQERTRVEELVEERPDITIETGFESLNGLSQEDLDRRDEFFENVTDDQEEDQEEDQGDAFVGGEVEEEEDEAEDQVDGFVGGEVEAIEEEEVEDEEPVWELVMSDEEEHDSEVEEDVDPIDLVSRMRYIYWWKEDDTDTAL